MHQSDGAFRLGDHSTEGMWKARERHIEVQSTFLLMHVLNTGLMCLSVFKDTLLLYYLKLINEKYKKILDKNVENVITILAEKGRTLIPRPFHFQVSNL